MQDTNLSKEFKKLADEMRALHATVKKMISFRRIVLRGLVSGVATAVGATIIATILIFGLARLIQSIGLSDWLGSAGLEILFDRKDGPVREQPTQP